jgi:hypothetical protein
MKQLLIKSIEMAKVKKRFQEWVHWCRHCGVAQTSADKECGRCTNCGNEGKKVNVCQIMLLTN